MLFVGVFICVCVLGYLAQNTGLCMVRGIYEWKAGNKEFLLAILFSGVLAWVAAISSYFFNIPFHVKTYAMSGWFLFGGFVFGLGAAFNNGCGISTLNRLTRGDTKMIVTIMGWLIGWVILADYSPKRELMKHPLAGDINCLLLIVISLIIIIWVSLGDKKRKRLWFGMMGIGLLAGFIYIYEPKWPPSGLLHQLSDALINDNSSGWPSLGQYLLFFALLLGMFLSAWKAKIFKFIPLNIKHWAINLLAGILMGLGASLAIGGNSVQLLLGLPSFSSAGFVAVTGMLLGIWIGISFKQYIKHTIFNSKNNFLKS